MHPASFYALSQSPQQFKQIPMVRRGGAVLPDRPLLQDEDLRADRQMEFTQVGRRGLVRGPRDIYALFEGMLKKVWKDVLRHRHLDAVSADAVHGRDEPLTAWTSPNLRFALEIRDFSETFKASAFKVFQGDGRLRRGRQGAQREGSRGPHPGRAEEPGGDCEEPRREGLAFIKVRGANGSAHVKCLSRRPRRRRHALARRSPTRHWFSSRRPLGEGCAILGRIRLEAAALLQKAGQAGAAARRPGSSSGWSSSRDDLHEEEKSYVATHHPFTAPVPEDIGLIDSNPKAVRGQRYDVVLNGMELAAVSIRIHQPTLQKKIFEEVLKIPRTCESRFGSYAAGVHLRGPPRTAASPSALDRIAALLCGTTSIRDVIAFPKDAEGQDLMAAEPTPGHREAAQGC